MRQHYFSHNGKNMFVNPLSNVVATNKSDSLVSLRGTEAAASSSSLAALLKGGYNAPRESMAPESLLQVLYQQQARQRQEAQAAQQAVLNPILLELVLNKATQSISSSTFPPAPTSRVRVPAQAAPEPVEVITVPCRARGMPQDHKFKTAHFKIPKDVKHGQELFCSYPACRDGGVKFCYCMHCRIPVAKRNFRIRHHHCDLAPPAPVQVETHRSTTPVSVATGSTAPATAPVPLPSTTTTAATQNQLANLILQSSLSQQLAPPPNNTTAQANTSRLDFLRELCFRSLSPGTLLPCPATNTMVAQLCPPVATVKNITNSSVATILNGLPPTTTNQTETSTVMLPCRARGMPDDHQFQKAHFVIPSDIQHGDELICSYPACRDAGVKFCFCTHCRIPVAKRNFRIRHNHCDFVPPPAIVGDYELSPQMTNNGRRTVICQEIMGDKKPAAATYTTTPPISAGIEISDSDMNSRNDSTSTTKKRKRHRTTLPTPPNTLGSQSYCAQSSAMMLQGGNDRLPNDDNRLAMVLAGLLGKRPPKIY